MRLFSIFAATTLTASMALTACNATETKQAESKPAAMSTSEVAKTSITLFESHDEGRINIFYDLPTFKGYKAVGETSFRLTRIGAGPNGETVVFGLPKADKKKGANTPAAMLWDGKASYDDFYGEMYANNRIYVFDNKADMDFVRKIGEPVFMFTDIGAGPKGETVVFVLNKHNKKKKPTDLIAKFKSFH
ncbi:hypothetical protein [Thiomicrorhabdus sp. Milos-T2]|uniref:hypothetical protein n=1 Tax=Thiomicrorhabdus sp. Milos-T2 TaxID=90814 RepID=UPI000493D27D|nr:hypothetical protein [Thiomicrorhabdus sp. Milos-T2]